MKKTGSLTFFIVKLVIIPMLFLSVIQSIFFAYGSYALSKSNVFDTLESTCISAYELVRPDGSVKLDGETAAECFDTIKQQTGIDITIFEEDRRKITTIRDQNGERAVGTRASVAVVRNVINKGEVFTSDKVGINGVNYFVYYMPLKDDSGEVTGMTFAGKSCAEVKKAVTRDTIRSLGISWLITLAVGFLSVLAAGRMTRALASAADLLNRIADGDTECTADEELINRRDEIGSMGRAAVSLQKSLRNLIGRDPLTKLYNRRAFEHILNDMTERAKEGKTMVVVMGDIDFFKRFNDQWGHACGDAVLCDIALIFRKNVGVCGEAARWGGEEFLLAFCGESYDDVLSRMNRIMEMIHNYRCHYNGEDIPVTMTFGVQRYEKGASIDKTIDLADGKLYYGKDHGRDRIIEQLPDNALQ